MNSSKLSAASRPEAPFRALRLAPVDPVVEHRADGSWLLRVQQNLPCASVSQVGSYLRLQAAQRPEGVFLAQPDGARGWREVTFARTLHAVNSLSQWLLDQGLRSGSRVLVLCDNSIHHAWLQLAALQIGVQLMAVSPAYSLMSPQCERVADLLERFAPQLVYADDAQRYANALALVRRLDGVPVLCDTGPRDGSCLFFDDALQTTATSSVHRAFDAVTLDTVARLQLTSGSTGLPKAVQVTHGNVIASGAVWDACMPFLADEPLRVVDWLPWSHTAGIHGSFGMALRHGGTLYIDDGKPVPSLIGRTVAALKSFRPNIMVNVPSGLDALVACMEEDPSLADAVFASLRAICYGGAALSEKTWVKLEQFSAQATGQRVLIFPSLGSTETTMPATLLWWPTPVMRCIGLPAPGVLARLMPLGDRYEIRFKGPNITPGYLQDAQASSAAFDDEGFLVTGDSVTFVDEARPALGLLYAGRMSENFKLATGTWVSVSHVREALLQYVRPWVQDVVLTGHNEHAVGAMLFLDARAIGLRIPSLRGADLAEMAVHAGVHQALHQALRQHNQEHISSSTRIARVLLLDSGPSMALSEITDKGYINQRAVLENRKEAVQRLGGDLAGAHDAFAV